MTTNPNLDQLTPEQLRTFAESLLVEVQQKDKTIRHVQCQNDKLVHEIAILKRHKFARTSEALNAHQRSLLDELVNEDLGGVEETLAQLAQTIPTHKPAKQQPKRTPLPANLPRTVIQHEPDHSHCACGCQLKRMGEDVSEKLDYQPGVFSVEQHVRGKWVCDQCETLTQAPVPAQVIDKGIPTSGLLAHVLVAKYGDHLPLYRQERIFARAGVEIARSTLADWVGRSGVALQPLVDALHEQLLKESVLHADETPVSMLSPGKKKTHRAYVWAYTSTSFSTVQGVVYHFAPGRAGEHARAFLENWQGKLVCDDFSGYKASFAQGVTEIGCMAHARRKFFDLHAANQSQLAAYVLEQIGLLYEIERYGQTLSREERTQLRQKQAKPILDALQHWLIGQRQKVPNGSAIARAIDYSLKRWSALTRYCEDGAVPIDNNRVENQMRPWAIGRKNWLFAGSLRSGQRAAAIMSLVQSAKLNGHDPYAYLKDVLSRLPTQRASAIEALLPHNWVGPINL